MWKVIKKKKSHNINIRYVNCEDDYCSMNVKEGPLFAPMQYVYIF